MDWFTEFLRAHPSVARIWNKLVDFGPKVIGVLVALFIAWIVAGWLSRLVQTRLERREFDLTLTRFFARAIRYAVIAGAVLGCLGVFGIQTTSFAAVIGAMGLAVGLAFQGTLSNFAAGVMLLVFRPFKVGDVVTAGGETGAVHEIELFTTVLITPDNRRFIIPNKDVFGGTIKNLTAEPRRRVDIDVGCDYNADMDVTRKALEKAAEAVENGLKDPAPQIFLKALGGSSVDWQVRVWCETADYWTVWEQTTYQVKKALDEENIGIPYPTMDINLLKQPD